VQLVHGDQYMSTDKVTFTHEPRQFQTEGQVRYQDQAIRLTAERAAATRSRTSCVLGKVVYQFNEETGNGTAEPRSMQGQIGTLTQATYSTCPPGERQWEFAASRITVTMPPRPASPHNATLRPGQGAGAVAADRQLPDHRRAPHRRARAHARPRRQERPGLQAAGVPATSRRTTTRR
jgi:LPS-assembly protein